MPAMPGEVAAPRIDITQLPPEAAALIARLQQQVQAQAREIAWRDAKLEKVNFELARLKRWKFGAKTEAMTAQQRALFQDTLAEDEASLQAQLAELQRGLPEVSKTAKAPPRQPRREKLPEHLERVEHHHEPADTNCPTPECGRAMQRIGEDVSEKLDIIPAKFFVHRHIYGKWACRCCQQLRQEPAEPDVVDGGIPASGLVAHTLISRFVDHLPYYRQEPINARSGVHTPRSTLATWAGAGGAKLEPLFEAHRRFILSCRVLHADETPVPLLDKLVILIAPIYNADGNERINVTNPSDGKVIYNRTAQNGPIGGVGTRENAKGMDLNRDYMKLESPEANALVGLMNRWDPHLTVDLHTTNGSYHGYHLTYSPTLNPNADARLIAFGRNRMLPAITRTLLKQHKFRTYYYGNFATKERMNRELDNFEIQRSGQAAMPADKPETKIWRTFDHKPMFGNNYVGLRNRLTILSEAYSYLDFKGRVAVTEAFVEEIFKYSALHAAEISALIKRVDADAVRGKLPAKGVAFEIKPLDKPVSILVGEVKKVKNPRNGRDMTTMVEDKFTPTVMPEERSPTKVARL